MYQVVLNVVRFPKFQPITKHFFSLDEQWVTMHYTTTSTQKKNMGSTNASSKHTSNHNTNEPHTVQYTHLLLLAVSTAARHHAPRCAVRHPPPTRPNSPRVSCGRRVRLHGRAVHRRTRTAGNAAYVAHALLIEGLIVHGHESLRGVRRLRRVLMRDGDDFRPNSATGKGTR